MGCGTYTKSGYYRLLTQIPKSSLCKDFNFFEYSLAKADLVLEKNEVKMASNLCRARFLA
jgi:phosphoenolpyruvate carboxylase